MDPVKPETVTIATDGDGGGEPVMQETPGPSGAARMHHYKTYSGSKASSSSLDMSSWSPARLCIASVVKTDAFDAIMIGVIAVNMCFVVVETDAGVDQDPPGWMKILGYIFLIIYVIEITIRLFVDRSAYFHSRMNCMDVTIVALDAFFQILLELLIGQVPSVSVLRVFRIMRLVRVIRAFRSFRELWLMLHGLAAAMKAMMWACVLIFVVLTIWSVISVEVLHKISKDIQADNGYEDCTRCVHAFSSVMDSMITWFIVVFAGDLWSDLAVPIIEKQPAAALIFLSAFVSINLGMLNLILTVIVDRASEARADDEAQMILDKKTEFNRATNKLTKLCMDMDEDESGNLTLDELEKGFDTLPDFQAVMKVMDVGKEDVKTVFNILDEDKSGEVTYNEFVDQLHKMKSQESHTLLVFIKHYITDVRLKVTEQLDLFKEEFAVREEKQRDELQSFRRSIADSLAVSAEPEPSSPKSPNNARISQSSLRKIDPSSIIDPLIEFLDEKLALVLEEAAERSKQHTSLNESLSKFLATGVGAGCQTAGFQGFRSSDSSGLSNGIGAVVVPVFLDGPGRENSKPDDSNLVIPVQVIRPGSTGCNRPQYMV